MTASTGLLFGIYPGGATGDDAGGLARGPAGDPERIRAALENLRPGGRPFLVRGYIAFVDSDDTREVTAAPEGVERYAGEGRALDLVAQYQSHRGDVAGYRRSARRRRRRRRRARSAGARAAATRRDRRRRWRARPARPRRATPARRRGRPVTRSGARRHRAVRRRAGRRGPRSGTRTARRSPGERIRPPRRPEARRSVLRRGAVGAGPDPSALLVRVVVAVSDAHGILARRDSQLP
jgi:hypothetical protein